jgi:Xaa-Pro aminopeptidase
LLPRLAQLLAPFIFPSDKDSLVKLLENRIKKVRKTFKKFNIDALLVLIEENRRYLSGFTGEDTQFDESAGALFISANAQVLATDSRYDEQAKKEAKLYNIVTYKKGLANEIPGILKSLGVKRLGFESSRLSVLQIDMIKKQLSKNKSRISLVPTENIVENIRVIKDEFEIEKIKNALGVAETAFEKFIHTIKPGMTEITAAWRLEKKLRESGGDAMSFPVICASGPNSALPHAIPGDRKIQKDEPIIFDFGVKLNGYCSDTTRTVFIGKPDKMFKKVFQTVADAQQKATKLIQPGKNSRAIDKIARDHIYKMGFKGKFGHSLGHGTGLAVHEPPRVGPFKGTTLKPGMIFTVEPGIYLQGQGGVRLENMIAVRDDGVEILNCTKAADFFMV